MDAPEEAVRPATAADLDVLVALAQAEVTELKGSKGGTIWARREAPADVRAQLTAAVADTDRIVLAGTLDGNPVGLAAAGVVALHDGAPLAVVDHLYVEPEARGVGLGEALMAALLDWARERGCTGIDAVALPGMRATKNFFEAHGLVARAIVVHRAL